MTITVWPVDPVDTNSDGVPDFPTYAGRGLRQVQGVLLGAKRGTRPLGGRSGVPPGTLATTVTISGTTVTIAEHCGVLDLETAAEAGPYFYALGVPETAAASPADGTNPRIDLVSLQLSDPAESDGSTIPSVAPIVTAGTAASSPVAPAAPARSLVLAHIAVPASGTGSPVVTWVAPNLVAAGGVLPVSGPSDYPPEPYLGQYVDDAAGSFMARWNGTAWGGVPLRRAKAVRDSNFSCPGGSFTLMTAWASSEAHGLTVSSAGITVPVAGEYWIACNATFDQDSTGDRGVLLTVNGSEPGHKERNNVDAATASRTSVSLTTSRSLAAGDVLSVQFFQNSGGALNVQFASLDVVQVG